jgi:uncharacterized protein
LLLSINNSLNQLILTNIIHSTNTLIIIRDYFKFINIYILYNIKMLKTTLATFVLFLTTFGFSQTNSSLFKVFYYESGEKSSEGFVEDEKPNGYWKNYYKTGILKSEGNRKNFLLDSIWKFYSEDGFLTKEITYKENIKHGAYRVYTDSNRLQAEYTIINDTINGEYKEFYPSGEVKKKGTYVNGIIEGVTKELAEEDGRVITVTTFKQGYIEDEEYINRKDVEGNKQGVWKEFHDNGKVKKEANFRNDKVDGIVKEFNKDGQLRTMEKFEQGEKIEKPEELEFAQFYKEFYEDGSLKLIGAVVNDKRVGYFREYDKKGNLLNCILYKSDVKLAEGMLDTASMYQGEWKFYYPNGKLKAIGKYSNDKKIEKWLYYHENEALQQEGEYRNGLPVGEWKWYHPNIKIKRQEFYVKGLADGESVEYDSTGVVLVRGNFIAGFREGEWYLKIGDHMETGQFLSDEQHGKWLHKYDNGQTAFEGEFLNGLPIGKHKFYHPNGQTRLEGRYEMGRKEGDWRRYDEKGIETIRITYKNDIEIKVDGVKYESPRLE